MPEHDNNNADRDSSNADPQPPPVEPPAATTEQSIVEPPTTVTDHPTVETPAPTPPTILDEAYREREAIALYHRYIGPAIGAAMGASGSPRQRTGTAMDWIRSVTGWRRLRRGQALMQLLLARVVEAAARQERHRALGRTLPRPVKPLWERLRDGEVPEHRRQKAAWDAFWRWVAAYNRAMAKGGQ